MREVGVRGEHGAVRARAGHPDRQLHRHGAVHLPRPHPDELRAARQDDRVRLHVPHDLPGEHQIGQLLGRGLALGDDLEILGPRVQQVPVLRQDAAHHPLQVPARQAVSVLAALRGQRQRADLHEPHVRAPDLALPQHRQRLGRVAGRCDDFIVAAGLDDLLRRREVQRTVQGDDAAKARAGRIERRQL